MLDEELKNAMLEDVLKDLENDAKNRKEMEELDAHIEEELQDTANDSSLEEVVDTQVSEEENAQLQDHEILLTEEAGIPMLIYRALSTDHDEQLTKIPLLTVDGTALLPRAMHLIEYSNNLSKALEKDTIICELTNPDLVDVINRYAGTELEVFSPVEQGKARTRTHTIMGVEALQGTNNILVTEGYGRAEILYYDEDGRGLHSISLKGEDGSYSQEAMEFIKNAHDRVGQSVLFGRLSPSLSESLANYTGIVVEPTDPERQISSDHSSSEEDTTVSSLEEDRSDDSISQELDMGDTIKLDGIGDIESDVSENLGNGLVDTKKNEEEIILKSSEQDDEELEKDKVDEEKVEDNGKLQGNKKRNQKRKVIITGCCILAVVIIVISLVIFFKLNDSEEIIEEEEHVLTLSEQREIINKYGKTVEDVIGVYFRKNNVLLEYEDAAKLVKLKNKVNCSVHDVYEDGLIFLDKCVIDGKTTKARYGTKQEAKEEVVKKEGNVHVYVNKTNSEATLIKPKYMDVYDDYSFDIDGVYSNLTLLDAKKSDYVFYIGDRENVFMINFKTGEKFLPQINYQAVLPIKNGDVFDTYRIGVLVDNKWGIYDIQSGSCVIYPRYDSISVNLSLGTSGPPVYASAPQPDMLVVNYNGAVGVIDYRNNKEIIPIIYNGILSSGDYLWAIDSKSIGHIYDFSGNVYLDNEYDKVYGIVDGKYVMVNDKDSIKLVLLNKDLVYDYGKLELGECSYFLSYNGGALFQFSKKDASGCVEVIYDGKIF